VAPLNPEQSVRLAAMFKALGDRVRLRLLSLIASHPGGQACRRSRQRGRRRRHGRGRHRLTTPLARTWRLSASSAMTSRFASKRSSPNCLPDRNAIVRRANRPDSGPG
jgi:DNA-binding transcriptional ArsR family regulator